MNSLHIVNNSHLNQPQHADNKFVNSPASVGLIALGVIFIIGGAVAAGVLHSYLGYSSLKFLGFTVSGIVFIIGGIYCGKTAAHSSTIRSRHNAAMVNSVPSTNNTEDSRGNSSNIVSIGSQAARLNEEGICKELKKVNKRQGVEVLIIYGDGKVQLNIDPGFVELNPKKVILVGARIVHEPCPVTRLDDKLSGKEEWLSSSTRTPHDQVNQYDPNTFVKQLIVDSIDEALAHKPPSRGIFKGAYHLVYQVNEDNS